MILCGWFVHSRICHFLNWSRQQLFQREACDVRPLKPLSAIVRRWLFDVHKNQDHATSRFRRRDVWDWMLDGFVLGGKTFKEQMCRWFGLDLLCRWLVPQSRRATGDNPSRWADGMIAPTESMITWLRIHWFLLFWPWNCFNTYFCEALYFGMLIF